MAKPSLDRLWTAFPDHGRYPSLKDLYTMLGGVAQRNIDQRGFGPNGNTCASRLSVAFNGAGAPIDQAVARSVGAQTIGTADGKRIIFRVTEFRAYLVRTLGKPVVDEVTPFDDAYRRKKGIIAFNIQGWTDATGHIALLRDGVYREPTFDNYSGSVPRSGRTVRSEFWELG